MFTSTFSSSRNPTEKFTSLAIFGACGTLTGYTYAKLDHLPVSFTTKAYTIWFTAQISFLLLAESLTTHRSSQLLLKSIFLLCCNVVSIKILRNQNVMHSGMKYLAIFYTIASTIALLVSIGIPRSNFTTNP